MSPLFSTRKKLAELAKKESEGFSFWTNEFSQEVKNKLLFAFMETTNQHVPFQEKARDILRKDLGKFFLSNPDVLGYEDFQHYFINSNGEDFVSVIEACQTALNDPSLYEYRMYIKSFEHFPNEVNRILAENRVSYQLVGNEIIEHKSKVLFTSILEPILLKTAHNESLSGVNKAFMEAIEELSLGKPANAITDASRALEESLRFLGAEGSGPGELFADSKKKGLLKPHDLPLFEALAKAVAWVSAQRTNHGDAHKQTEPENSEAWATVYICGALILKILDLTN